MRVEFGDQDDAAEQLAVTDPSQADTVDKDLKNAIKEMRKYQPNYPPIIAWLRANKQVNQTIIAGDDRSTITPNSRWSRALSEIPAASKRSNAHSNASNVQRRV